MKITTDEETPEEDDDASTISDVGVNPNIAGNKRSSSRSTSPRRRNHIDWGKGEREDITNDYNAWIKAYENPVPVKEEVDYTFEGLDLDIKHYPKSVEEIQEALFIGNGDYKYI